MAHKGPKRGQRMATNKKMPKPGTKMKKAKKSKKRY